MTVNEKQAVIAAGELGDLIAALAPANVTRVTSDVPGVVVRGTWPGHAGEAELVFERRPDGRWAVSLLLDDGLLVLSRRLRAFSTGEVLRLQSFLADPIKWFKKEGK